MKFIEIFVLQYNFFTRKKTVVETISVIITDSYDVQCLDLYLIDILTKSAKAERRTDTTFKLKLKCLSVKLKIEIHNEDRYKINILGTHYFVLLVDTLGAWQTHNASVHLIFSALIHRKIPPLLESIFLKEEQCFTG